MQWLYSILGVSGFLALITLIGGYVGFRMALSRREKSVADMQDSEPGMAERATAQEEGRLWVMSQSPEDIQLTARDGLTLRGWYLPAARPSDKLVICAHGYRFPGTLQFGAFARLYREELNYNVLYPDHRAYGRSEGKYIGFSALEWEDILDWAAMFAKRLGPGAKIALHGISMGGATVMLCNANDPPDYIKCVAEDCGFTNGYEIIKLVTRRDLHIHFPPLDWAMLLYFRLFNRRSLKNDADPYGNVSRFKLPTLFIHGTEDLFIPVEMCRRLYEAAAVPKDLLLLEGAGHALAYFVRRDEYEAKLREFLERWMA